MIDWWMVEEPFSRLALRERYWDQRIRRCGTQRRQRMMRTAAIFKGMTYPRGCAWKRKFDGVWHCVACGKPCPGRRTSYCSGGKVHTIAVHVHVDDGTTCGESTWRACPRKHAKADSIDPETWPLWACVEEWSIRSDPRFLRAVVFARDRGICAGCGVDCVMSGREWQADHVIALHLGGDGGLRNVQTLCVPCHNEKSAEEARRRAR